MNNTKIQEITIKVPWGHIAGKWWGSKDIQPIVCLHGRGDNAGSFDRLIPLLPTHLSYFAIDLPGHGLSSKIPTGQIYSLINFIYWIYLIQEHFKWHTISLLAHSMSAVHCFLYAGLFPERCNLIILLDAVKPLYGNPVTEMQYIQEAIKSTYIADRRNQIGSEPPSYTVKELIEKITQFIVYSKISKYAAQFLLRGIIESKQHPGKYYLPFDRRMLKIYPQLIPRTSMTVAKNINIPFCFIKSQDSEIIHLAEYDILRILQRNPLFEKHLVDGDHHVHLTEPDLVSGHISNFLNKYSEISHVQKLKGKL